MPHVLATTLDGCFRARLVTDSDARNPREEFTQHAHAITVDTRHGRYLPVDQDGGPLAAAFRRPGRNPIAVFTRWARLFHGATVIDDNPPEGARALWYMTGDEIKSARLEAPQCVIEAEIRQYRAWAAGEVFGFVVEERARWTRDSDPDEHRQTWEAVDGRYGFYDLADARAGARDTLGTHSGSPLSPHGDDADTEPCSTVLHITHNPGGTGGSLILCGVERGDSYRAHAEGTADRYIDRYFVARGQYMADPSLCRDCLETHDTLPNATLPVILRNPH